MADITLSVTPREKVSSTKLVAARKAGKVPAVMYGNKGVPQMLWVDFFDLQQGFRGGWRVEYHFPSHRWEEVECYRARFGS